MKKFILLLSLSLFNSINANAQLSNGSIAPDFWLTDLDGNSHNLYTYLDQGKVVFIEFFACHCPSCWAYHNTNKLKDLYAAYGPAGTDQLMVLMLEHDEYNGYNEFHGITQGWPTQGDWVSGNPIPIVNVEGNDRWVFSAYNMTYYPMIYKVCPDKTVELMSTTMTTPELYSSADNCPGTLNTGIHSLDNIYVYDGITGVFDYQGDEPLKNVEIFDLRGQSVKTERLSEKSFRVDGLEGIYIIHLTLENNVIFTDRLYVK